MSETDNVRKKLILVALFSIGVYVAYRAYNTKQTKIVPKDNDINTDISDDFKFNKPPPLLKRQKSVFENIMMNTTVLSNIRKGKLYHAIDKCTTTDIAHFFPIIAAMICKISDDKKKEQDKLLKLIRQRSKECSGLRQTINLFMLANDNTELVRKVWRHNAFMITLSSSRNIFSSIDDHDIIPSIHKSNQLQPPIQRQFKRQNSKTMDDFIDDKPKFSSVSKSAFYAKKRIQTVRGNYNNNVKIFRKMANSNAGDEYFTDRNGPKICDPIHENQEIYRMKVKKVFQSAAKPVLIETFDEHNQSMGSIILKVGDDLRQDENVMFMFHFMNAIWEEHRFEYNGIPIRALTYFNKAMGNDFGCIELIENCISLRDISLLKDKFLNNNYLLNNLIATTVGSYVGAYIMGTGDRHYDNILIRKEDGTLFHIDFGFILGEKVSMDTSEFAITSDLYSIIVGLNVDNNDKLWNIFINCCIDGFMILRQHINELINFGEITFTFLKVSTPIKQFFHQIFATNLSEDEMKELLRNKLEQAPFAWNTKIKNVMHSWATSAWYPHNIDLSVIKSLSFRPNS